MRKLLGFLLIATLLSTACLKATVPKEKDVCVIQTKHFSAEPCVIQSYECTTVSCDYVLTSSVSVPVTYCIKQDRRGIKPEASEVLNVACVNPIAKHDFG